MNNRPINIVLLIRWILIGSFVATSNCAKIQPPPGGPADLEGIRPIQLSPSPDQTQVDIHTTIEIVFDSRFKPIDPNLITLSPFPKKGLQIIAKGRKIRILPQEPLLPNQTYRLTISPEIRDEQNNPMPEPIEILFSTGNTIDHGKIKGIVYDSKNRRGVWIWAWKLPDKFQGKDPSPFEDVPDYVAVTDSMGFFQFTGLADGKYRLIAIDDINRSRKYEPSTDKIGLTFDDPIVPKDSSTLFPFHLALRDTSFPAVQSIRMISPRLLTLRLTYPIQGVLGGHPLLRSNQFDKWLGVLYHDPSDSNRMYCLLPEQFTPDSAFFEISNFVLQNGTTATRTIQSSFVHLRYEGADTLRPYLWKLQPQSGNLLPKTEWVLSTTMGLMVGSIQRSVKLIRNVDSTEIPIFTQSLDPFVHKIVPANSLPERNFITLIVQTKEWFSLNNVPAKDSILYFRFYVLPFDTLGTISVQVKDEWRVKSGDLHLSAISLQVPNQASSWVKSIETFSVNSDQSGIADLQVPPGLWRIRAFRDINDNDQLDVGQLIPFSFAEPFVIDEDTIRVRSKWTIVPKPIILR
ncbi:MAG: Ig-like domain-containing protein [bacterium]|nr:Ig-like domain-containing protein [bacterium]